MGVAHQQLSHIGSMDYLEGLGFCHEFASLVYRVGCTECNGTSLSCIAMILYEFLKFVKIGSQTIDYI